MNKKVLFSSNKDDWETPKELYKRLNLALGPFDLDPAASAENTKCEKFFDEKTDGLIQNWDGYSIFINPPYSKTKTWLRKAVMHRDKSKIVLLVASRTDVKWYHECVKPYASAICFIEGRVRFEDNGLPGPHPAPFPSLIVCFGDINFEKTKYLQDLGHWIKLNPKIHGKFYFEQ